MQLTSEGEPHTPAGFGGLSRRCRFCADPRPTEEGDDAEWTDVWDDAELQKLVYYYTPIKVRYCHGEPITVYPRNFTLYTKHKTLDSRVGPKWSVIGRLVTLSPGKTGQSAVIGNHGPCGNIRCLTWDRHFFALMGLPSSV